MKNGMDDNSCRFNLVENCIGEPAGQCPPIIIENGRIHGRVSLDEQERCFKTTQEFQTQAKALLLIPGKSVSGILPGLGGEIRLSMPWIQGSTS